MIYPLPLLCHFWHKDVCRNGQAIFADKLRGIEFGGGQDDEFDPQRYLFIFQCQRCQRIKYVVSTHQAWPFPSGSGHVVRPLFPAEEAEAGRQLIRNMS